VALACRAVGSRVLALTCDVRDADQVQAMVGAAIEESRNILDETQAPLQTGEISQAMMFLASDAAKYMTGVPLLVDAGFMTK
jgi:NAD(P)-dependent dehydrogenase (short-subunit alcohol dehydrogenase family)